MIAFLFLSLFTTSAQIRLSDLEVEADPYHDFASSVRSDTQEGKILTGKKITTTKLDQLPVTSTNNYRQALSQTAGLSSAEVGNEAFSSLSSRGLGDPHETFNIQTLMDGLPISADMYGYPANYFVPPFQMVDRIEFLRGGAALLYGPQLGGALNYISRAPHATSPFSARVGLIGGSFDTFNSYNEISGTKNLTSYHLALNRRQSEGLRDRNSAYAINFGQGFIEHKLNDNDRLWLRSNLYSGDHETAGGLALNSASGVYSFKDQRFKNPLQFDQLEIRRWSGAMGWKRQRGSSEYQLTVFGGVLSRDSFTQSRGSAPNTFGVIPLGTTNVIQRQDFHTAALESRYLQHWSLGASEQTLTAGVLIYHLDSPYREETGNRANAQSGSLERRLVRQSISNSFFAENRASLGRWSITPGIRVENLRQVIDEKYRAGSSTLRFEDRTNNVPLLGLGITYALSDDWELYGNASEAYTPVTFANAVPTGVADTISEDIEESHSDTQEIGVRGETKRVRLDASVFQVYYANLFGRSGTRFINTGAGINRGIETAVQWKAREDIDLYANAMLLKAEFASGPNSGKTPQYAPDFLVRAGVIFRPQERDKIALMGTWVDQQYADDANTTNFNIPAYEVFDLTFEKALREHIQLVGGINNLLDKVYYSRIRGQGIDPAAPRNYYVGLQAQF